MKFLIVAGLLIASPAYAATYSPTDAAKHVGESVTVEGKASVYVARDGTIFIDFGGSGSSAPFHGVIFERSASILPNASSYNGRTADVTGTIKDYKGKPEIIISNRSQLTFK